MYYNRIQIMGNLGKDPEIRYFPDGTASAKLSVAYSEKAIPFKWLASCCRAIIPTKTVQTAPCTKSTPTNF
ncbi:TPA: single-stranded DNA-binding protein [Neisseria meningitidis]